MSYRNPRFSMLHAARQADADKAQPTDQQTFVDTNGIPSPTLPISRVFDNRWTEWYEATTEAAGDSGLWITTDRVVALSDRRRANRILIPPGQSIGRARGSIRLAASHDLATYSSMVDLEGQPVVDYCFLHNESLIDIEFQGSVAESARGMQARGLRFELNRCNKSQLVQIPEICWTQTVQPVTGVAPEWDPGSPVPYEVRAESRGGVSYLFERGRTRRRFSFRQNGIEGPDKLLYEAIERETQRNSGLLWYEHPGTGAVYTLLDGMNNAGADWTADAGTSTGSAAGRATGLSTRWTLDSTGGTYFLSKSFADLDLRHKMLKVVAKPVNGSWATLAGSFDVRVNSSDIENESRYFLGEPMLNSTTPEAEWYVFYVDMDADPESQGTDGAADLSSIQRIRFRWQPTATSDAVDIDEIGIVDKAMQPALCRIDRWDIRQDSRAPSAALGPTYRVSLDLEEVIV